MKTTIIVPTYNEKENIEKLIKTVFGITKKIKNHDVNILVVDDNSPDGTKDVVKKLQKKYKKLHLITGKKEGLGKAYLRGMRHASSKLGAEVMFEMDADFSHDPKALPSFFKKIDEGYDLVIGSRYIPGGSIPDNWGMHRKFLSVFGNMIVRLALFHFEHKDWTTGYRAIKTPLYKKIRSELETFKGYTFQVSFLHKAFKKGAKVAEVPIQFVDRVYGHSKIGSEYVINLSWYLIHSTITDPPRQVRFLVVGGTGFTIQATTFAILKNYTRPELANTVGAAFAITSNFILNNFWTFGDRSHQLGLSILFEYIKFFVLSLGSIVIQAATIWFMIQVLGEGDMADWSGFILGVLLGLFWNYTMYSKVVWRKKK